MADDELPPKPDLEPPEEEQPPPSLTFSQEEFERLTSAVVDQAVAATTKQFEDWADDFKIEGAMVSGAGNRWEVHERSPDPEFFRPDEEVAESFDLRRWRIERVSSDPPTIKLNRNGGLLARSLHGEHGLDIVGAGNEFPVVSGNRFYLKFEGTIDNDFTVTLLCDSAWSTSEPVLVDGSGNLSFGEFYYPIGVAIPYDADRVEGTATKTRADINFGAELDLMIINLAPDSNLMVIETSYIRREDNNKAGFLFTVFPPAGPFVF